MIATAPTLASGNAWHRLTVTVDELPRAAERIRRSGAVITSSRRMADSYVLTYVV